MANNNEDPNVGALSQNSNETQDTLVLSDGETENMDVESDDEQEEALQGTNQYVPLQRSYAIYIKRTPTLEDGSQSPPPSQEEIKRPKLG